MKTGACGRKERKHMTVGRLWAGFCIIEVMTTTTLIVLIAITWQKIGMIYDIVRKRRDNNE